MYTCTQKNVFAELTGDGNWGIGRDVERLINTVVNDTAAQHPCLILHTLYLSFN